ncbi:sigma-70 family RNA polymerase sigma factor [Actinoplanes sp. NPDC026619]|uniref:RNA polymerase sigma factor n=1 Tax=Actinoplanes sp. NPDC026619 TaxID=3155798 RepID=UPI0033C247EA
MSGLPWLPATAAVRWRGPARAGTPGRVGRAAVTVIDSGVSAHDFVQASLSELHCFARSRLKRYDVPSGRMDADDVVQYTVAEVLERWNEINNPRQYMFTVARRYVLRAVYEGQRFTGERPDHDELEDVRGPVASRSSRPADEAALERIMAEDLHAALRRLTPQQRRAVVLIELGDVSRATAAAEMAVATGAVSAHRDRGLKKLRAILRGQGGALLTAAAVFGSILLPFMRSRSGGFAAAGAGTSWDSGTLVVEVIGSGGLLVGLAMALFVLSRVAWATRRVILRRARSSSESRKSGLAALDELLAASDDRPPPSIEEIAHQLRRLTRQRRGSAHESEAWLAAVERAYDDRLVLACHCLGITEHLRPLEGMDRDIERIRVESELQGAGLVLG